MQVKTMLLDFETDELFAKPDAKKPDTRPLALAQDPLALSWASYQITKKNPQRRWTSLEDLSAMPWDIEMADTTRRYYRDKIMMANLRGTPMTKFKQDLYDICNNGVMTHDHLGMIYRLPYFYEEDTTQELLFSSHPTVEGRVGSIAERQTRTLVPIQRLMRSRARNEVVQFWFKDEHNRLVMWAVTYSNTLRPLVESIFEKGPVTLSAFFHVQSAKHSNHKFQFWQIGDVRIV